VDDTGRNSKTTQVPPGGSTILSPKKQVKSLEFYSVLYVI